jgi:hypothetical protein
MLISIFPGTEDGNAAAKQLGIHRISAGSEKGERRRDNYR